MDKYFPNPSINEPSTSSVSTASSPILEKATAFSRSPSPEGSVISSATNSSYNTVTGTPGTSNLQPSSSLLPIGNSSSQSSSAWSIGKYLEPSPKPSYNSVTKSRVFNSRRLSKSMFNSYSSEEDL